MLSGCLLQLPTPAINVLAKEAYNDDEILIPYEMWGESSYATARWTLGGFNGTDYETFMSKEVRLPSGGSGVLDLGNLPDERYELVFELLTTRDGSLDPVPYLTQRTVFYVDRAAPANNLNPGTDLNPPQSTPQSVSNDLFVTVSYVPSPTPIESPERVLFAVGNIRPPVPGQDELDESGVAHIWSPGDFVDGPDVLVYFVIIDKAGNRSPLVSATYQTIP